MPDNLHESGNNVESVSPLALNSTLFPLRMCARLMELRFTELRLIDHFRAKRE
jgi:hypothetical protein